jgi:hypothetical protein
MGQTVSGNLVIDDQAAHLRVKLPWFLQLLAKPILHKIEQQGRLLLGDKSAVGK